MQCNAMLYNAIIGERSFNSTSWINNLTPVMTTKAVDINNLSLHFQVQYNTMKIRQSEMQRNEFRLGAYTSQFKNSVAM